MSELSVQMKSKFKEAMKEQGVTQEELANRLGVSRQYVNRVLNNFEKVQLKTVVSFSKALGYSVSVKLV